MKAKFRLKGGEGSGHHDHQGRPGMVGGSVPDKFNMPEKRYYDLDGEIAKRPGKMSKVRRMAAHYGAGFEKGDGYYYFTGHGFYQAGVYIGNVASMTVGEWETELRNKLTALYGESPKPKTDRERRIESYTSAVASETGRRRLARLREGVIDHMRMMSESYLEDRRRRDVRDVVFADREDLGDINAAFGLARYNYTKYSEWELIYNLDAHKGE